jgi:hypothetical protein
MTDNPKRRGGLRIGAGRKRKAAITRNGEVAFILRHGDTVAVLDATGPTLATVTIADGAATLTNERGQSLTLIQAE